MLVSAGERAGLVRAELRAAMERSFVAAQRLLGNGEQARDACQEAAARALSASDRYDPGRPFYPWFYKILRNHCLDRIAERRRGRGAADVDSLPAAGAGAEHLLAHGEREAAVARAVTELPDDMREIIELRHFQELPYEMIAAVLDVPEGTVMSRLYRARKRLREILLSDPSFTGHGRRAGGRR